MSFTFFCPRFSLFVFALIPLIVACESTPTIRSGTNAGMGGASGGSDGNGSTIDLGSGGDATGSGGSRAIPVPPVVVDGCGDGNIDAGEECDDGNAEAGDGCNADCKEEPGFNCPVPGTPCEECGNGIKESSEECDDANSNSDDGCSSECQIEGDYQCPLPGQPCQLCGNGRIEDREICDDGNSVGGDGCSADCAEIEATYNCVAAGTRCEKCGDGVQDPNEACDDGNNFSLDGCLFNCSAIESGFSCVDGGGACQSCGNGRIEGTEVCDDNNTAGGDGCSADCSTQETGFLCAVQGATCYRCGNGIQEGSSSSPGGFESCDDGGACSSTTTMSCTSDGQCPSGERCVPSSGDGCDASCQVETTGGPWVCPVPGQPCVSCGNGQIDGSPTDLVHEECDDGNTSGDDGCSGTCQVEIGATCVGEPSDCIVCGDGLIEGTEECDDDNFYDRDGCSSDCKVETGLPWTCPNNAGVGGSCFICGNGVKEGSEPCDDGNSDDGDGCSATCTIETDQAWTCEVLPGQARSTCDYCGNGVKRFAEECDDGDIDDGNGCSNSCVLGAGYTCPDPGGIQCNNCGDGVIEGLEVCDELAANDTAGCSSDCLAVADFWTCPKSGDADEGSSCTLCGDGAIDVGEACDDGNNVDGDGCRADCRAVENGWDCSSGTCTTCGNGVLNVSEGEACDDGNRTPGDGCDASCAEEANWSCFPGTNTTRTVCDRCGNGVVRGTEECDDGGRCSATTATECTSDSDCPASESCVTESGDGCDSTCQTETSDGWVCPTSGGSCYKCGNSIIEFPELCDEGSNTTAGCDACLAVVSNWYCGDAGDACTLCGNAVLEGDEVCDDGDVADGSGWCAGDCKAVNPGWICSGNSCTQCGNGTIDPGEQCDDGNSSGSPIDGCDANCQWDDGNGTTGPFFCRTPGFPCEECGNGINEANEECDDGNANGSPVDGCDSTCRLDSGWSCSLPGVGCNLCGNGTYEGVEQCDDMNSDPGDGCFECQLEPGWSCSEGGTCVSNGCGDGFVAGAEECDDGNRLSVDGCSAGCRVETGWVCPQSGGSCARSFCGDSIVNGEEQCDNGGLCSVSASSCTADSDCPSGESCTHSADATCDASCLKVGPCGDGQVGSGEECDDARTCSDHPDEACLVDADCSSGSCGSTTGGDGCAADCSWEPDVACLGKLSSGKYDCDNGRCSATSSTTCNVDGDCPGSETCVLGCGNGVLGNEEGCDDGNTATGDGCDDLCQVEGLYTCDAEVKEQSDCNKALRWVQVRTFDVNSVNPEALHFDPRTRSFVGYKSNEAQTPVELCLDGTVLVHPAGASSPGEICAPGESPGSCSEELAFTDTAARSYIFDATSLTGATYDPGSDSWYFIDSAGLARVCDLPHATDGFKAGYDVVSLAGEGIAIGDDGRLYVADAGGDQVKIYDRLDSVTGCDVGFDIVASPETFPMPAFGAFDGLFALTGLEMLGTYINPTNSDPMLFRFWELDGDLVATSAMTNTEIIRNSDGTALTDVTKGITGAEAATDGSGFIMCFNSNSEDCKLFSQGCETDADCERTAPGTVCRTQDELGDPISAPYCWAPATARDDYSTANTADTNVPVDVLANDTLAQSVCRGGNLTLVPEMSTTYGGTVTVGTGPTECGDPNFGIDEECLLYDPPSDGTCNIIDSFNYSSMLGGDEDKTATVFVTVSCDCGNGVVDAGEDCDQTAAGWDGTTCDSSCNLITVCGNGVREGLEQCDVLPADPDVCSWDCKLAGCGNGIREGSEECDDGNATDGDGCNASCVLERCGNGILDLGEECDNDVSVFPAAPAGGDGCSAACEREPLCGDGIQEGSEECDDGNAVDADGCRNSCVLPYCGDGNAVLDPGEQCDDGNNTDGDGCTWNCRTEACGDGTVNSGEECDEGMVSSLTCRGPGQSPVSLNCTVPKCGDEVLDAALGEQCDDDSGFCRNDCTQLRCGDGIVDPTNPNVAEQCDDGNDVAGDGCFGCLIEEGCGDGIKQPAEVCDFSDPLDPNASNCSFVCQLWECGNVLVDPGEECDEGTATTSSCRGFIDNPPGSTACTVPRCGDGIHDVVSGEECDDGNDVEGDGCNNFCLEEAICGNGNVEAGEECDDGNTDNDDGCSSTCKFEGCGNGVREAAEACDYNDPMMVGFPCRFDCSSIVCGDGVVDPGEECDEGTTGLILSGVPRNGPPPAGCSTSCVLNTICGDGISELSEECDDGNMVSGDGCSATCRYEYCGNGALDPGEECDDGGNISGDGCSSTCQEEPECGDGKRESPEQCDPTDPSDPNRDSCSDDCRLVAFCGDGITQTEQGEECDPADPATNANCSSNCTIVVPR